MTARCPQSVENLWLALAGERAEEHSEQLCQYKASGNTRRRNPAEG